MDLETMTNHILRNDYSLHNKDEETNEASHSISAKRGYGLDQYYEEEERERIGKQKYAIESEEELFEKEIEKQKSPKKGRKRKSYAKKAVGSKKKTKVKKKKWLRVILAFPILIMVFLFLFFKTTLFQPWKELWVQTAMTTMSHQYLATWFLSQEEIDEIMKKLEVENKENSDSNGIMVKNKKNGIQVERISGSGYVGYVMVVENASQVKLVDGRKSGRGSKLSEIVKENKAIAGTNAGGFADPNGVGSGNILYDAVIMNRKLVFGNKNTKYRLIGLSRDHKLVLGTYNYQEALNAGIESAVEFGPFLIVNGKDQIKSANSGGIQPRMAIGQKKDGTFIFVCIDGRQPGYSIGTNLLELQTIFKKYGAINAANLDGGSSATMYYDGKVVNKTSTPMGERYLPNAFIVEK